MRHPFDITQPIKARRAAQYPPRPSIPVYPAQRPVIPAPPAVRPTPPQGKPRLRWWMIGGGVVLLGIFAVCGMVTLGVGLIYANGILPGVQAAGISLAGLTEAEAAARLQAQWQSIVLKDGDREWPVDPALLGISLDGLRTAQAAYAQGRGEGGPLSALLGRVSVPLTINVDLPTAEAALADLAPRLELAPVNAGVQLVAGVVSTTPPADGRILDLAGTLEKLRQNPGELLADGKLELAMFSVAPAVTDASPMVAEAERLLSSFLDIRVYDPMTGDSVYWSIPPQDWASWLTAAPDASSASGLALDISAAPVRDYLNTQAESVLDPTRYIKPEEGVASLQQAIRAGRTEGLVRVYHQDRQHSVQPGETIVSIAWDYGVPYPWIQQANPGVDALTIGQTITIPSVDHFLPYPVVPDKRIVVSISQQRVIVYENGQVKWDWPASTGITSSPTWPGIYQIQSHEVNAYAGNWNLWMPNFMGVYQPIPGSEFTNGFHGFPTRGGGQLLWENSLGTRVTYGCILLSNVNSKLLYDWAEEGVVVEIQP